MFNAENVTSRLHDLPNTLYTLMHWIIVGPRVELQEAAKANIDHVVLANCQNIMYSIKSSSQVKRMDKKPNSSPRTSLIRENPQVVGLS